MAISTRFPYFAFQEG